MQYGLGVDLGTTQTAAAVLVDGRVEVMRLGGRRAEIPSLVFVKPDGGLLIGEAAERRGQTEPARLAREFKRRMGDPVPILVGGTPFSAHALTGKLLRHVLDTVTQAQGEAPAAITVTHPANWGPYKREQLDQAIRLADAGRVQTRSEPEAAALQHATARRIAPGETVAVYDLGGGTFDAAVLRREGDGFVLLGEPEGVEQLGGSDFDEAVFGYVLGVLGDKADGISPDDPEAVAALARLRRDCVEAKESLSFDTETMIPVALPGLHTRVRLNRSELEAMISPSLADTVTAMSRALRTAGVSPGQLSAILLAGGSSRIPLVSELLSTEFQRPVVADPHPEHSIAMGAAVATAAALGSGSPFPGTAVPMPRSGGGAAGTPSGGYPAGSSPQRGAAAAAAGLSTTAPPVNGNGPVSPPYGGGTPATSPYGGNAPISGPPTGNRQAGGNTPISSPPAGNRQAGGNTPISGPPTGGGPAGGAPSAAPPYGGNTPVNGGPSGAPPYGGGATYPSPLGGSASASATPTAPPLGGNAPTSGAPVSGNPFGSPPVGGPSVGPPFGTNAPTTPVSSGRGPISFSRGAAAIPGTTPKPAPGGGAPGIPGQGPSGVPGHGLPGVPGKSGTDVPWPPPPLPAAPGGEKRNVARLVAIGALVVALLAGGTTAALLLANGNKGDDTGDAPTTPATTGQSAATAAAPMPTDTMLVRVDTGGNTPATRTSRVYTFTPGSPERKLLLNSKVGDALPKWSHDRKQIALTGRDADGDETAIWIMNADGSHRRQLVEGGGRVAWSADDTKIAFIRKVGNINQIFVVTIATGAVKQLTHAKQNKDDAMWSPDGKTILYWLDKENVRQVYELTVADPKEPGRQITRPQDGPANDPAYSPDGKQVLYTRDPDGQENSDIWLVNTDGSNPHQVTNSPQREMDPTWSPDGTWFAFVRGDLAHPTIVAERPDGTGETVLTAAGHREAHPCWF